MIGSENENQEVGRRHHRQVRTEHKVQAVLRLLKGEDVNTVAQDHGVSIERLERWQARFLEGGRSAIAAKKNKKGTFSTLTKNSKALGQWTALLILLIITVLILVKFLNRDTGQ